MTEQTRAYWRFWGPVAAVGVGLVVAAVRGGGAARLVAAVAAVVTVAAMWLAWVIDDAGRTARVQAWLEGRRR